MTDVSLAAMERLLKKAGAKRISEDAKTALRDLIEAYGEEIAERAVHLADHAGRRTVSSADVKLAKK